MYIYHGVDLLRCRIARLLRLEWDPDQFGLTLVDELRGMIVVN